MGEPEEETGAKVEEASGIHWVQALIWGVFLTVVMFGLGFLAGSRWAEQRAVESTPALVSRLVPPPVESRPRVEEEAGAPDGEPGGQVWGILTGQEKLSPRVEPPSAKVKAQEGAGKAQTTSSPSVNSPGSSSSSPGVQRPSGGPGEAARAGSPRYHVQAISVQSQDKAEAIVRDLASKGYPAPRIVRSEIPGRGAWYRIRVGMFEKREEAEGWSRQLRDRERMQPQVVAEKN